VPVTEPDMPDDAPEPHGLHGQALAAAKTLRAASLVLAVPALAVGSAAALALVVVAALAGTGLASRSTAFGWVVVALAVAALVVVLVFLLRVRATLRAGRDHAALAAELLGLIDISELATATVADLSELTSRTGGIRAVSRARALWRLLRRLDPAEHASRFERAKWFIPPEVGLTWLLAQVVTWSGLAAWVAVPLVVAARATGRI
jgi:hypothetical protein